MSCSFQLFICMKILVAHKNQAWIISVLDDVDANKAIVLAGSLRRVLTTKKIVAVYTPNVSEDARFVLDFRIKYMNSAVYLLLYFACLSS